ncbi:GAF and ANTAR domain-containing protein [Modestobacter muralis]|uniref:GAF and ANTAR domain-containing protein n=1 Tax=Modestobacter muralis TaxID=1608614 RepID=UPI001B8AC2C4|nr:GAF and ANTAR domain-containing protein [Modestobacter muralis]
MTVLLDDFHAALAAASGALPRPELLPEALARACVEVLPVDGAGISLLVAGRRTPLGASDPDAVEAERLQSTVGEGPCLSAHAEQSPVVADEAAIRSRWPGYHDALVTRTPIRAVISLPLRDSSRGIGALDLYLAPPRAVTALSLSDALTISSEVSTCLQIQDQLMRYRDDGPAWLDAPAAGRRSSVWQAVGMVHAALGVGVPQALALLRARAFADDSTLDDLAARVLDHHVTADELALDPDTSR